jgi:hypothetical protein
VCGVDVNENGGVPKHSDFEPDYLPAKGNGKPAETCCLSLAFDVDYEELGLNSIP